METDDYESCFVDVRKKVSGDRETFEVTIPIKVVQFMGLSAGDRLKMLIKKVEIEKKEE